MMQLRSLVVVVLYVQYAKKFLVSASDGHASCPCITTAKVQENAATKPDFLNGTTYGYGCAKHDGGNGTCNGSKATAPGQSDDWCEDEWCIVNISNCAFKSRAVTYTKDPGDYFSYKTCDNSFTGNGRVGREACLDQTNSYCTAAENTPLKGDATCPCVLTAKTQTAAAGKPAYVTGTQYGYFCQAHDDGKAECGNSSKTGNGEDDDWCKDKWCIVDVNNCSFLARAVSYTADTTDYFSYKTCDSSFAGNGWVDRAT